MERRILEVSACQSRRAGGRGQVSFKGLDEPVLPETPAFIKALDLDHALDGDVMVAYAMNGEDLPWLNGFPLRLVVPGFYGTYWIKHLAQVTVLNKPLDNFWMAKSYRIPKNACACVEPGKAPTSTTPIGRFNVRSFLTSVADGASVPANKDIVFRGIAFDGGAGISDVVVSADGGASWIGATLGEDLGKYSFREWKARVTLPPGKREIRVRAANRAGQSQPLEPLWNFIRLYAQRSRNDDCDCSVRRQAMKRLAISCLLFGSAAPAMSAQLTYDLPPETAELRPAPGVETAILCKACHSVDYIATQPSKKGKAFWEAEVQKMINTFKAPINTTDASLIIDYLAATY